MPKPLAAVVALELALGGFLLWQLAAPPGLARGDSANDVRVTERAPADRRPPEEVESASTGRGSATSAALAADERSDAVAKWNRDDPLGVLLSGTVRWRDGDSLVRKRLRAKQGDVVRDVTSSDDGGYAIVGLSPGECAVEVNSDESGKPTHTIAITLGDEREQHHDLVLDRSVSVRVFATTPAGQPLRDQLPRFLTSYLQAAAGRAPLPARLAPLQQARLQIGDATWKDEPGAEGALGTLQLHAPPPVHVALMLGNLLLEQRRIEPGTNEVQFVIDLASARKDLASVTLRLADTESGAALVGYVTLGTAGSQSGGVTDGDGRFIHTDVFPGPTTLATHVPNSNAPTHEELSLSFRIAPGARLDLGELRLHRTSAFAGRIVNPNGTTVPASVDWIVANPSPVAATSRMVRTVQCDSNGAFTLQGAAPGPIAVVARFLDKAAFGLFDNPPPQPAELRLGPASLVVVTRGADLGTAFVVTCFDAQRRPIGSRTLLPSARRAEILLPIGTWHFDVTDQDGRDVTSGTWALDGTPRTLELP